MIAAHGHVTVLLKEAVEALQIRPDGFYVDATFGRGGHSREILSRLGPAGRLVALDRDPQAVAAGQAIADPRFRLYHRPFAALDEVLAAESGGAAAGINEVAGAVEVARLGVVDGILFDLGVSSPQLDEEERGFSFRTDGPLDMRMDTTQGETAAEWLERASVGDITEVIRNHGEERFAFQIAKKIVAARGERRIATTRQLAALVAEAVRTREPGQDPATRTFQALRIHVNQELAQLALTLPLAFRALKDGGRLVVISFHSLEDRIVKRFVQAHAAPDRAPKKLPLRADQLPQPDLRPVGKPLRPSAEETAANPRARSAIMRVAEKLGRAAVAGAC